MEKGEWPGVAVGRGREPQQPCPAQVGQAGPGVLVQGADVSLDPVQADVLQEVDGRPQADDGLQRGRPRLQAPGQRPRHRGAARDLLHGPAAAQVPVQLRQGGSALP